MIKIWLFLAVLCISCIIHMSFWSEESNDLLDMPSQVDFSYHIQPILSKNCYSCHGNDPSSRKAGLRLDSEDHAKSKLESGKTAIVGKSLRRSELIHRILSNDPDVRMPPTEAKKNLSKRDKALLEKWIKQGATWDDHWAFIKPKLANHNANNMARSIEGFISQAHKSKNLAPAKEAGKRKLVRRVSYALTGLPPRIDQLTEFLEDTSPEAYEKMLDRFLASPHFGERWARHWMDLVRYGESMGHEGDFNISNAYEYRDYVIRAFNQDVGYDLFIKEHLAGDMLKYPRFHPTEAFNESQIGTSYFFLGEGKHGPVDIKLEESEKIDNMIDVTSKTFSALTVACAKCHDHKFDPIPTTDYYSMYGMVESSRLVPKAARKLENEEELVAEILDIKSDFRDELVEFINKQNLEKKTNDLPISTDVIELSDDSLTVILADFRSEEWTGWYTDGIAFGDKPAHNEIDISYPFKEYKSYLDYENKRLESKQIEADRLKKNYQRKNINIPSATFLHRFASSRVISTGLQGVLHGPNFTNDFDTIAIRARGNNGTLRIVVDNFQVFQGPLWDRCEIIVNDDEWKTYKLSAQLAKGNKAYLEFFPGKFKNHVFGIKPDDYIEIQWAIGYSGEDPLKNNTLHSDYLDLNTSLHNNSEDITIDAGLNQNKLNRLIELQESLYDPSHFIGMAEGDAVLSSVFKRGSIKDLSLDKVPHHFLSSINVPIEFPQNGSGRLAWAESLVHPENPLTARVMVNRIWHHLFGRGIVETVDNFGIQGQIPSHPELLDYLAVAFMDNNWSIKTMIKEIMMSSVYKMATLVQDENIKKDPSNIYLHAFPIRRLEAESIRDGILAVSGCLDSQMYGHSVPVYLSNFMTGRGRPSVSGPIDSYGRRSIYQSVRRNFMSEMMITFDMPIPFTSFGKRNITNVPAQSLTLLNDEFVHEQSYYWAEELVNTTKTSSERLDKLYSTAFSRLPSDYETEQAILFLEKLANKKGWSVESELDNIELWAALCHSIFNMKEFIHLI